MRPSQCIEYSNKGGGTMKRHFFAVFLVFGIILGTSRLVTAADVSLKEYNAVVVQDLQVPSGSPAPESAGMQMAEKAVFQIKRYNQNNKFFDTVVKEGG